MFCYLLFWASLSHSSTPPPLCLSSTQENFKWWGIGERFHKNQQHSRSMDSPSLPIPFITRYCQWGRSMSTFIQVWLFLKTVKILHSNSLLFKLCHMIWILKEKKNSSIVSFLLNIQFDSLFCSLNELMPGWCLTTGKALRWITEDNMWPSLCI